MARWAGFLALTIVALGAPFTAESSTPGEKTGEGWVLEPGWNFVETPHDAGRLPEAWDAKGVDAWWTKDDRGERAAKLIEGAKYWVYARTRTPFEWTKDGQGVLASGPKKRQVGTVDAPAIYADASTDRLWVWDPAENTYRVVAESGVASSIQPHSRVVPGSFELAGTLVTTVSQAVLPDVALSVVEGTYLAHVVYAVRGEAEEQRDRIGYYRSEKAGKVGSFEPNDDLARPPPGWTVVEVAVAARKARVGVAWIESAPSASGGAPRSRLWMVESHDGGRSFSSATLVHESTRWKRGLDMDYDRFMHHHLVWGAEGKVYYLKNLEGEASNVFDVQKREEVTEEIKYKVQYPPKNGTCTCEDCWCEDAYVLRPAPDSADEGSPIDSYRYRIEARDVYQPALLVDDHQVTIVGRQMRLWDNKPVFNKAWLAMYEAPVYSKTIVQHEFPTKYAVGWRRVWKTAYDVGDEHLWAGLGYEHQYLYEGTWREQDEIMVAQRPLVAGAWAREDPNTGWKQSTWRGDTLAEWRISSAGDVGHGPGDGKPSYPRVVSTSSGMHLVYEDGASEDPNRSGFNPIHLRTSTDGGLNWSMPRAVGVGYVPVLGATEAGEVSMLYYVPSARSGGAIAGMKQTGPGEPWQAMRPLNTGLARPVHGLSHGADGDALLGRIALAAREDLLFAAWIEHNEAPVPGVRLVTSRASPLSEVVRYDVALPSYVTSGQGVPIKVTAENVYHMHVDFEGEIRLRQGQASPAQAHAPLGDGPTEGAGLSFAPSLALNLSEGLAALWVDAADMAVLGDLEGVERFDSTVHGTYKKARWMRERLLRLETSNVAGDSVAYQVEYEPVSEDEAVVAPEMGQDAQYLAGFERVWAYTQGIALAQFAREASTDGRAGALARYLCEQAQRSTDNGVPIIKGWHFSWNTRGDQWKDARLVTGANAWVIHGLGIFLTSTSFEDLPADDQTLVWACYQQALRGLELHRVSGMTEQGTQVSLMTAGFSARGLDQATTPWTMVRPDGGPLAVQGEHWDYYDVLDAIGYETFDAEQPPRVTRRWSAGIDDRASQDQRTLTEGEVLVLQEEVQVNNVVTEHNLDVLSVLNHALNHADYLGLDKADLQAWRDEVRDGIFYVLWEDRGALWRRDLEGALKSAASNETKREEIKAALDRGETGRVSTGGVLVRSRDSSAEGPGPSGPEAGAQVAKKANAAAGTVRLGEWQFVRSEHVAIDNCSWLSLSVDYEDLQNPDYVDRLAECLEFTTLVFAKSIRVGSREYYGTHYFLDAFEDRYISASSLQEESFHLEATAGLILALIEFADRFPEHPRSAFFEAEAWALWTGVQDFVVDHGFPYSSQRIQDLSTRLTSSTALIWFIDVYKRLEEKRGPAETEESTTGVTSMGLAGDLSPLIEALLGAGEKDKTGGPFALPAFSAEIMGDLHHLPQTWVFDFGALHDPVEFTLSQADADHGEISVVGGLRWCGPAEVQCQGRRIAASELLATGFADFLVRLPEGVLQDTVFPWGRGTDGLTHLRVSPALTETVAYGAAWIGGIMLGISQPSDRVPLPIGSRGLAMGLIPALVGIAASAKTRTFRNYLRVTSLTTLLLGASLASVSTLLPFKSDFKVTPSGVTFALTIPDDVESPDEILGMLEKARRGLGETEPVPVHETQSFALAETKVLPALKTKTGRIGLGRGLYGGVQSILGLEPQMAAFLAPVILPLSFGLGMGAENDLALETMVVLTDRPHASWVKIGSIQASQVMQGLGSPGDVLSYFYSEAQIRAHATYQPSGGTAQPFEDDKVYAFDLRDVPDFLPLDEVLGEGDSGVVRIDVPRGLKSKPKDGLLSVFVLDTEKTRGEIIDTFLAHHLWWQQAVEVAAFLPANGVKEAWLRTVRSMLLGFFFDANVAAMTVRPDGAPDQRPFWWRNRMVSAQGSDPSSDDRTADEINTEPPSDESPNTRAAIENDPPEEAYWYTISQKPVYWGREIEGRPFQFEHIPSKRSMVPSFNDYSYIEGLLKTMFLGRKILTGDQVKELMSNAIPTGFATSVIIHGMAKGKLEAKRLLEGPAQTETMVYVDVVVTNRDGWSEIDRFYNPLNSPSQMTLVAKERENQNAALHRRLIEHQLQR